MKAVYILQITFFIVIYTQKIIYLSRRQRFNVQVFQTWNSTEIQSIFMDYCNFGDRQITSMANHFNQFPNIKNLSLTRNSISPKGILNLVKIRMPKLQNLTLSTNKIKDSGLKALLQFNLSNLRVFALKQNNLTNISIEILSKLHLPHLQMLSLSSNNIQKSSEYFSEMNLPNLKFFDLTYCNIGDLSLKHILKINQGSIQQLYLDGNQLSRQSALAISQTNFQKLKKLSIGDNLFGVQHLKVLSKSYFPELINLSIKKLRLTDQKSRWIKDMSMKKLQELNLDNNLLTEKGVVQICQNLKKLKNLSLSSNLIYSLNRFNLLNSDLQVLVLSENMITQQYFDQLCHFNSLKQLSLYYNYLQDNSIIKIHQCNFSSLKILDIGSNAIKSKGFEVLSQFDFLNLQQLILKNNPFKSDIMFLNLNLPKLKILNLQNTRISSQDFKQITKWNIKKIEKLIISNNNLNDSVFQYLSLLDLSYIKAINIEFNKNITGTGFKHLKNSNLTNLSEIHMYFCNISDEGMQYFSRLEFPNLQLLYILKNFIGNLGLKYLSLMKLPNLIILILQSNKFNDQGFIYLNNLNVPKIGLLAVGFNQVSEIGLCKFLQNKDEILALYAGFTRITDNIFNCLSKLTYQRIQYLILTQNEITDQGIRIMKQRYMEAEDVNLRQLYLSKNFIGNQGLKYLSQINLSELQLLDLRNNEFNEVGVYKLIQNKFEKLQMLFIGSSKFELLDLNSIRQKKKYNIL